MSAECDANAQCMLNGIELNRSDKHVPPGLHKYASNSRRLGGYPEEGASRGCIDRGHVHVGLAILLHNGCHSICHQPCQDDLQRATGCIVRPCLQQQEQCRTLPGWFVRLQQRQSLAEKRRLQHHYCTAEYSIQKRQ